MHVQQVARVHQGGYYVQALAIELHSHKVQHEMDCCHNKRDIETFVTIEVGCH
jgi:hypothetical protein